MPTLEEALAIAVILVALGVFMVALFWAASLFEKASKRSHELPPVPDTPMWTTTTTKTYKPAEKKEDKT